MTNKSSTPSDPSKSEKSTPLYGIVDERTQAVVYQGDAYTGRFMLFAVLIDVVLRSTQIMRDFFESNWDLMFIVIIGGLISTAFQVKNKIIFNRPVTKSLIFIGALMGISAIVAMVAMLLLTK